jgi:hypothetical protein
MHCFNKIIDIYITDHTTHHYNYNNYYNYTNHNYR